MKINLLTLFSVVMLLTSCNINEKLERHDKAQKNASYIMNNLTDEKIFKEFPEKYFPKEQIKIFISDLKNKCDWSNRNGKFVDFFTMNNNGKNSTAYIYEYFLNCDSLRFVLIYDMESKKPELFKFNIEPIEQHSPMIIDPSKQLIKQ